MKCPYDCKDKDINAFDSSNGKREKVKSDDVGMCYNCGGWWIFDGIKLLKYIPTEKERELVGNPYASRQRSLKAYKNNKAIKP